MKLEFKSTKNQLLVSFFLLTITFIVAIFTSFFFLNKLNDIRNVKSQLINIQYQTSKTVNAEFWFLLGEDNYQSFHNTGDAFLLELRDDLIGELRRKIDTLSQDFHLKEYGLNGEIVEVKKLVNRHDTLFNDLIKMIKYRGVKNSGLQGKMNEAFANLLNISSQPLQKYLIELGKLESDFLSGYDTMALHAFNNKIETVKLVFQQNPRLYASEIEALDDYAYCFNELATLKRSIGEFAREGLMVQLESSVITVFSKIAELIDIAEAREKTLHTRLYIFIVITIFGFVALSVILSIFLANYRSKPINELTASVNDLVKNDSLKLKDISKNSPKEVEYLKAAFDRLLEKLESQLLLIEEKNAALENQNEELKKVNSELDKFVYSVSHDLRAPLASLLGLINLSKKETDLDELAYNLDLQECSVKKLDNFIGEILALSRNARLEVVKEKISVKCIVEKIIEDQKFFRDPEKYQISAAINEKVPFYSDPHRLQIILNNLIANAIKYYKPADREQHQVVVSVEVKPAEAVIVVEDNGIGIAPEHIHRIFEMFYRATDHQAGSGLGLYITKETVEKLNGRIEVESTFGKGSRFVVTLPNYYGERLLSTEETISRQYAQGSGKGQLNPG